MRIRVKLVAAITAMVSIIVVSLSFLYLSQLLSERIQQSYEHNDIARPIPVPSRFVVK